jgi:hypothetical protein
MSTNPQGGKAINQKRGPTTGNAGNASKRADFMSEKSTTGSERSKIANMITDALSMRGRGTAAKIDPALEGIHSSTNVGRGPTKGNAGKR